MHDSKDSDRTASTPAEGVRILGAEEAQAAVAGERRASTRAAEQLGLPSVDLPGAERAERDRDVAYPDAGPSWSAATAGDYADVPDVPSPEVTPGDAPGDNAAAEEPPTGEVPPLPHWTEPPTGAVPAIFADDADEGVIDDDLEAWSTISGNETRFRAEGADWAEADFADELNGDDAKFGALDEDEPVDEEAAFAEALARRRRKPQRASQPTARPKPRPRGGRSPDDELSPPGPAAARDLPTAIITAALILVVAFISFRYTTWTAVLASVIVGIATLELCNTLHSKGMRPATLLALAGSFTLPLAAKHYGPPAFPVYFALIVVFSMLWFLWKVTPGRPTIGVATTVFAFGYVGGLGGFAGLMLSAHDGVGLILGVAICTVAYDVAGFFVGSQFGKSRVAPDVSPNKTVAGTVAGMLASVFFGWLAAGAIAPWTHGYGFVLGVLIAVSAFLGDLCESMIKRDLGVKDFGSLLPGHGGVLDRFDGLLFSLPIAYYLALHFVKF